MAGFRRLDAFVKTRPDLQQKSAVGGIITVVAATTAALLFVGQIIVYVLGNTHHSLRLSRSYSLPLVPVPKEHSMAIQNLFDMHGKIPLRLHVTFPHLNCDQLDLVHDGASYRTGDLAKHHGKQVVNMRKPTLQEMHKIGVFSHTDRGCTIEGFLRPQVVAGILQITVSNQAWAEANRVIGTLLATDTGRVPDELGHYNVSHYIHKIEFGRTFSKSATKPLEERAHIIKNDFGGIAVEQIQVRLVPTVSRGMLFDDESYQTSVVTHTIQPQTLVTHGVQYLPGLVMMYDFVPLTVHQTDGRDNFFVFLSSLISIVAGVFVTVGLLAGCVLHSASVVAKKVD